MSIFRKYRLSSTAIVHLFLHLSPNFVSVLFLFHIAKGGSVRGRNRVPAAHRDTTSFDFERRQKRLSYPIKDEPIPIVISGTNLTFDPLWEDWAKADEDAEQFVDPIVGVGVTDSVEDTGNFLIEEDCSMYEKDFVLEMYEIFDVSSRTHNRKLSSMSTTSIYPDWTKGERIVVPSDFDLVKTTGIDIPPPCDGSAIRSYLIDAANFNGVDDYSALSILTSSLSRSENNVDAALTSLCTSAANDPWSETVPFEHVTRRGRQFDQNFFNGGTSLHRGLEEMSLSQDAWRENSVRRQAIHTIPIELPTYLPNFQDGCPASSTIYCCFTKESDQKATSRGTIFKPISSQKANAKTCYHDIARSPTSARVANGRTLHEDSKTNSVATDHNAKCVGFAWTDVEDNTFLGNLLIDVSMLGSNLGAGLAGNIPGAPTCGCAEFMPTVTLADCRESLDGTSYLFSADDATAVKATYFRDCRSDLRTKVESIGHKTAETMDIVSSRLVGEGNCGSYVRSVLDDGKSENVEDGYGGYFFGAPYVTGTAWWFADETNGWTPLIGKGEIMYHPDIGSESFRRLWENFSHSEGTGQNYPIIRRVCRSCAAIYRDIYYVRITPLPSQEIDLFEILKDRWTNKQNVLGKDFRIYSSQLAAKENRIEEAWSYCNYSNYHGFPFQCGPAEGEVVSGQWNSFEGGLVSYATDLALYMEAF